MNPFPHFAVPATQDKWTALADTRGLERMCFLLEPTASEDVCEVGTGRGNATAALARYSKRVVTFDIVDQSAHIGKLAVSNIEFRRADLGQGVLPCEDGSFDIVICRAALHHLADKKCFCHEVFRVLRPNGRLYVMDPVMSPELRLAWGVMSRITERDYQGYVTEQELLDGISEAGFDLRYVGHFLFPRSLSQLIDERLPLTRGSDGGKDTGEFLAHMRRTVWKIVREVLSEEMRSELHFDSNSPEGWFAYNCAELVACRR